MTIYVDNAFIPARVGQISARWCHLTGDTKAELHEFATRIGLRRSWFQDKPGGRWHYDVTESIRAKAIGHGAVATSWRHSPAIYLRPGREGREHAVPLTRTLCPLPASHTGDCARP